MPQAQSTITVPVDAETAAALQDPIRLEALGRLLDNLVHPLSSDPLIAAFEACAAEVHANGLTTEDVERELAAYNAERRG